MRYSASRRGSSVSRKARVPSIRPTPTSLGTILRSSSQGHDADDRPDDRDGQNGELGGREQLAALLAAGHDEQDGGRGVDDERHQDELRPGGEEQERGVDGGQRPHHQLAAAALGLLGVGLAGQRELERVGGRQQERDQGQSAGQVEGEVEGVLGEQRDDQHDLDQDGRQQQGRERHVGPAGAPQEPGHVVVLGRHEQHLGGHQRPGQVGAEDGHDQADADERLAPLADDRLQDAGHRGLAQLGDLAGRQDAIGHDRDRGEDGEHAQDPRIVARPTSSRRLACRE
jgi:hypothetical protein